MICRYHNIDCNNANGNGYCKTSTCVNPKFVVNIYPTDMTLCVDEKNNAVHFEESKWHTGKPTEKGIYLCIMHIDYAKRHILPKRLMLEWNGKEWIVDGTKTIQTVWEEGVRMWQKIDLPKECEE